MDPFSALSVVVWLTASIPRMYSTKSEKGSIHLENGQNEFAWVGTALGCTCEVSEDHGFDQPVARAEDETTSAVVSYRRHCHLGRHFPKDLDRHKTTQHYQCAFCSIQQCLDSTRGVRVKWWPRSQVDHPIRIYRLDLCGDLRNFDNRINQNILAAFRAISGAIDTKVRKLPLTKSAYGDPSRSVWIEWRHTDTSGGPTPRTRARIAASWIPPFDGCVAPFNKHISNKTDKNSTTQTSFSKTWVGHRESSNGLFRLLRAIYRTATRFTGLILASTFPRVVTAAYASPVRLPTTTTSGVFEAIGLNELDSTILRDNDPATSLLFACLLTGFACESLAVYRLCPAHRFKSRAVAISLLCSLAIGLLFCSNIRQIMTVEWLGIHLSLTMVSLQGDLVSGCFGSSGTQRTDVAMKHLDLLMC